MQRFCLADHLMFNTLFCRAFWTRPRFFVKDVHIDLCRAFHLILHLLPCRAFWRQPRLHVRRPKLPTA